MFGIFFINSVGLRRLLTDYGYLYNPLKKDFPLVGYTEVGYNEILRRISIVSTGDLQLARGFKFGSWWAV